MSANYNYCVLVGNLTRDPQTNATHSGTSVVNFNLAVNNTMAEDEVLFIPCVAFGKLADIVATYTSKGKNVLVSGRLVLDKYTTREGENRSRIKLYANSIQLLGSNSSSKEVDKEVDEYDI